MPGSIIGDECWRQMTLAERTEVVRSGRATLRQLAQGLLDGPADLRDACRYVLAHTHLERAEDEDGEQGRVGEWETGASNGEWEAGEGSGEWETGGGGDGNLTPSPSHP